MSFFWELIITTVVLLLAYLCNIFYGKSSKPNSSTTSVTQANDEKKQHQQQLEAEANRKKVQEAADRKKAQEEADRKKAQEEANRKKAQEEANRKKAQEEADRKKAQEEADRKKAQEQADRKKAQEEADRKKAEEEANRKKAQEEANRKKVQEEADRKKAQEEADRKRAQEQEDADRKKAQEEAERKRAQEQEDADRKKAQEEADRKKAQEEADRKRAQEEADRKKAQEEAERRKAAKEHEERLRQEEEARVKKEEEERLKRVAQAREDEEQRQARKEAEAARIAEHSFDRSELSRCVFSFKTRVDTNISKNSIPPKDVLLTYIHDNVAKSIRALAANAPASEKDQVRECFEAMHWDIDQNRPVDENAVDVQALQATLNKLCELFPREHTAHTPWTAVTLSNDPTQALVHTIELDAVKDVDTDPTAAELADLSKACERLWQLDAKNRLVPGDDYVLDLGCGKKPYQLGDKARNPLFTFVEDEVMKRPSFHYFVKLLNNYIRDTGSKEIVTHAERLEEDQFLECIMETPVMEYIYKYLKAKNIVRNEKDLIEKMRTMWFKLYNRDTRGDSSGFEHVFVGEVDEGVLKGMHNWIQLYMEEKAGRLEYLGYIKPRRRNYNPLDPFDNDHLVTLQFEWCGHTKPVSTSFVGVTPEYEMGLYTLCYLMKQERTLTKIDKDEVRITVHGLGRDMIGTSYPEDIDD